MKPRVMGGFVVLPTPETISRVTAPTTRAALIRTALDAATRHVDDLHTLRADTILAMRNNGVKWVSIAAHFRIAPATAFKIASERRAELARTTPATQAA